MQVVWDPKKARANHLKHGISFSDAEGVLFDPLALTSPDETSEGEPRFITIGMDYVGRAIVVVHVFQGTTIRLISARRATRKERIQYEEGV